MATSIASSGPSSLPFARRYMLQTLQTPKHSLGMPHPAANRHPKATTIASYKRSSLPFPRPSALQTFQTLQNFWQAKPCGQNPSRPNQSLLLGVQACRLPAFTSFKRYPKARSMASSRRSSLPFTTFFLHNAVLDRKLVPRDRSMVNLPYLHVTGHIPFARGANVNIRFFRHNAVLHRKLTPRPDQWLLLGVQAGRLPPFSFTTPSLTENWFPQAVRWSICPVFTSLATFP